MYKYIFSLICLLGVALGASAQGYRYQNVIQGPRGPLANVPVAVCSQPATISSAPCSPLATLYTDSTLTTACNGTNGCSNPLTSDGYGNVLFYATPGKYTIQYYGPQFSAPIAYQDIVLPCDPSNCTITGGNLTVSSLNKVVYADQYANVQAAINALPSAGGIVFATSPSVNTTLGTIDPGTKAITIFFGPYNYSLTQLIVRNNLHVYGAGSGPGGTDFQAAVAGTDPIVLGTGSSVQGVLLQSFRLDATIGNTTQNGIRLATPVTYFFENSAIDDVNIGSTTPFGGVGLDFDGTNTFEGFIHIRNVFVARAASGSYACQWLGNVSAFKIERLECDGTAQNDGGTNINIASTSGSDFPSSLQFDTLTTQKGNIGVNLAGSATITFINTHEEQLNGGWLLSTGTGVLGNYNVTIKNSELLSVGVNAGNGYIVKAANATVYGLNFIDNRIGTTPDAFLSGAMTSYTESGTLITTSGLYRPYQAIGLSGPSVLSSAISIAQNGSPSNPASGSDLLNFDTSDIFGPLTSTGAFTRSKWSGLIATGTATLTGTGACATNSTQKGGAWAGQATCTGTTGASTFVITPGTTAPNGWSCTASDLTTAANILRQSAVSTTACTIAGTVNANDVLTFTAVAY